MHLFRSACVMAMSVAASSAFAQSKEPPKASTADVEKVVVEIKGDAAKMQAYCTMQSLESHYQAAEQTKDEQKLAELDDKLEQASKTLGENFDRIVSSELDDESAGLLEDLAKTCK